MAEFNMQYIYNDTWFMHIYVFNKYKDVKAFCDLNDFNVIGSETFEGFVLEVKNKNTKYGNRIILFYKNDSALVHEIIHVTAIFNEKKARLDYSLKTSETHAYFGGWVWDSIKSKKDKKKNKLLTGWEPVEEDE